jgi:cyclopropane fatty-acyl-phospholipid synthase-like methyltransferase
VSATLIEKLKKHYRPGGKVLLQDVSKADKKGTRASVNEVLI